MERTPETETKTGLDPERALKIAQEQVEFVYICLCVAAVFLILDYLLSLLAQG